MHRSFLKQSKKRNDDFRRKIVVSLYRTTEKRFLHSVLADIDFVTYLSKNSKLESTFSTGFLELLTGMKKVKAFVNKGLSHNKKRRHFVSQMQNVDIFRWLLRTVMMHPVFGISYFVRLGAFRDMPHFVRRDIFAFAKGILRQWHSGILFAHTTAVGNSTRRSRISLRSNRTRVRRE